MSALALMLALAGCAALGAWLPGDGGWAVFATGPFRVVAAALVAALAWSLILRWRALRHPSSAGGWLLHLGLVVLVGAAWWHGRWSRAAIVEVVEGQSVALPDSHVTLRLEKVFPVFHAGRWSKGDAAEVSILRDGEALRTAVVRVNEPLRLGASWLHLDLHGYAPQLLAAPVDFAGPGPRTFVSLRTTLQPVPRYWRRLEAVPGTALAATAVFQPGPRPGFPRDPKLTLVLEPAGRPARTVTLTPAAPAFADGYRFELGEVRRWGRFRVSHEPGLGIVFASFALMIAGAGLAVAGEWRRVRG